MKVKFSRILIIILFSPAVLAFDGRLITDPSERQQMDNQLLEKLSKKPAKKKKQRKKLEVNGIVIRHHKGVRTVWINQKPINRDIHQSSDGKVIKIETQRGQRLVKPGQRINLDSGKVTEFHEKN